VSEDPNVLTIQPNGPNVISGDLVVATPARMREMKTAVLCRCGRSFDKPFCDGTHVKTGFSDRARLPASAATATAGSGRVTITPLPNGPNQCAGPLTIRDADGRTSASDTTRLCRCGGSQTKPYCDGTHAKIGFIG
jgi:CDGSH-type Zn-finger protein